MTSGTVIGCQHAQLCPLALQSRHSLTLTIGACACLQGDNGQFKKYNWQFLEYNDGGAKFGKCANCGDDPMNYGVTHQSVCWAGTKTAKIQCQNRVDFSTEMTLTYQVTSSIDVTASYELTTSAKATVGAEGTGGEAGTSSKVGGSFTIGVSSMQGTAQSQKVGGGTTISTDFIQPGTCMGIEIVGGSTDGFVPFSFAIDITGGVALGFDDKVKLEGADGKHYHYYFSIGEFIEMGSSSGVSPLPGLEVVDGGLARFTGKGKGKVVALKVDSFAYELDFKTCVRNADTKDRTWLNKEIARVKAEKLKEAKDEGIIETKDTDIEDTNTGDADNGDVVTDNDADTSDQGGDSTGDVSDGEDDASDADSSDSSDSSTDDSSTGDSSSDDYSDGQEGDGEYNGDTENGGEYGGEEGESDGSSTEPDGETYYYDSPPGEDSEYYTEGTALQSPITHLHHSTCRDAA